MGRMQTAIQSRRVFLKTLGMGTVGFPLLSCHQASKPYNVLFIVADDLRFQLGCYGDNHVKSPNIDGLAQTALLFKRAYAQQAVCNPSRASVLSGRRPDTIKVWGNRKHFRDELPDEPTLPQYFKQNGYLTQCIGKIFHNAEGRQDPESWSVPSQFNFGSHWKDWVVPGKPGQGPDRKQGPVQMLDVEDEAYWDGRIAAEARSALRDFGNTPFFLAVGFWKPHLPFNAPKRYWDLYDREELPPPANPGNPRNVPEVAMHNWDELRNYQGIPKEGGLSDSQIMELRHGYYAAISFLDTQIGKVIGELRSQGLYDNTIIVLWSDHGFHLGEHNLWGKATNFELDTKVPLMISVPGFRKRPMVTEALTELIDLYPSLVDLCGLPPVEGPEGTSFRPLLRDPYSSIKDAVYSQFPRPAYGDRESPEVMGYSIRMDRYRYNEWRDFQTGRPLAKELYDHTKDPGEDHNIVDELGNAEIVKDLAYRLQAELQPRVSLE
jgi:iduronate 2-sulfatase